MPAPEDDVIGILGGDNGVTGQEGFRGGKDDETVGICDRSNYAANYHFLIVVVGFPQNFGLGNLTYALFAVTLHGLELVLTGGIDKVAVGAFLLAQVGRSFLNLGGQLADDDGLENLFGSLLENVHQTGTNLAGGVVVQGQGDGIGRSLHIYQVNPLVHGLHLGIYVGNDVRSNSTAFALGHVINRLAEGDVHHLQALGFYQEGGGGNQADTGVGHDEQLGGSARGQRRNLNDLVLVVDHDREIEGIVAGYTDYGAGGSGCDRVVNRDGLRSGIYAAVQHELNLEGLGEGDVHHGVVGQGEDHLVLLHLDVGEDAVYQGGAFVLHLAQFGLLAIHLYPEVAVVVNGEHGRLVHGNFVAVDQDGDAVNSPYQRTGAALDHTQHGSIDIVLGTDLEVLHVTVGVGDGDTDGFTGIRVRVFLDFGHEHTLASYCFPFFTTMSMADCSACTLDSSAVTRVSRALTRSFRPESSYSLAQPTRSSAIATLVNNFFIRGYILLLFVLILPHSGQSRQKHASRPA